MSIGFLTGVYGGKRKSKPVAYPVHRDWCTCQRCLDTKNKK